jgi:hypothetical protein
MNLFFSNVSPNFSLDGWVHLEYGNSVIIIFLDDFQSKSSLPENLFEFEIAVTVCS